MSVGQAVGYTANYTNVTEHLINVSKDGLLEFVKLENQVMGGWIGVVVWLMVVSVLFITLVSRPNSQANVAFGASAFAGFVIGLFLRGMNLVPEWFFYMTIILLGVGAITLFLKSE